MPKKFNIPLSYRPSNPYTPASDNAYRQTSGLSKEGESQVFEQIGEAARQEKQRASIRKEASNAIRNKGTFQGKKVSDMSFKQQQYVTGLALENDGRIFEGSENPIDDVNPINWIYQAAGNLAKSPLKAEAEGSRAYGDAIGSTLVAGMAGFDPLGSSIKNIPTILNQTYKLNPWAFKPNPNNSYRVIGNEVGINDAMNSGFVRPNPNGSGGGLLSRPSDVAYYERGKIGDYPGNYIAETEVPTFYRGENNPVLGNQIKSRHYGAAPYNTEGARYNLPVEDVNFYKKDWLQGYKKIKEDGGKVDTMSKKFQGKKMPEGGNIPAKGVPISAQKVEYTSSQGKKKIVSTDSDYYQDLYYNNQIATEDSNGNLIAPTLENFTVHGFSDKYKQEEAALKRISTYFNNDSFDKSEHANKPWFSHREYDAVANMWSAHGKPKIVFDTASNMPSYTSSGKGGRPFYNTLTNTIHLNGDNRNEIADNPYGTTQTGDFVSELAHAEQYKKQSLGDQIGGQLNSWLKAPFFGRKSYDSGQYKTSGTVENTAHQEIEPQLEAERSMYMNPEKYQSIRPYEYDNGGKIDYMKKKWNGKKADDGIELLQERLSGYLGMNQMPQLQSAPMQQMPVQPVAPQPLPVPQENTPMPAAAPRTKPKGKTFTTPGTGDLIAGSIGLANALLPNQMPNDYRQPQYGSYNANAFGTGSTALYDDGGMIPSYKQRFTSKEGGIKVTQEVPTNLGYGNVQPDNIPLATPQFTSGPKHISYESLNTVGQRQVFSPKFQGFSPGEIRNQWNSIPQQIGGREVLRGQAWEDLQGGQPHSIPPVHQNQPIFGNNNVSIDTPDTHYSAYHPETAPRWSFEDGGRIEVGQKLTLSPVERLKLEAAGYRFK